MACAAYNKNNKITLSFNSCVYANTYKSVEHTQQHNIKLHFRPRGTIEYTKKLNRGQTGGH